MKRKRWAERHKGLLIMGGTLLTLALAVTGSCQYYMQPQYAGEVVYDRLWSTILYSVVKLYTFSPTVNIGIRTPLCYEIARWAAPLCTAYWLFRALEAVLRHRIELLSRRLGKRRQIAVFGYNEESAAFLQNLAEESEKKRRDKKEEYSIALITEQMPEQELQLQLERKHILVYQADVIHEGNTEEGIAFIRKCLDNFSEIVLFYEDGALNFTILKNFMEYVRQHPAAGKRAARKGRIHCAVRCEKKILKRMVADYYDHQEGEKPFELTSFSMPEMAAWDLFEKMPLYTNSLTWTGEKIKGREAAEQEVMEAIPNPHLLIAGFGRCGQAVFEEALIAGTLSFCSRAEGYERLRITIVDENCARCRRVIESRYPRIEKICDVEYIDENIESIGVDRRLRSLPPVTYIAVCFSDQTVSVSAMEKMAGFLTAPGSWNWIAAKESGPVPIGVRMRSSGAVIGYWMERKREASAYTIQAFGTEKQILTHENVIRSAMEERAKNFNAAYAKIQRQMEASGEEPELTKEELWDGLSFEKKESNRAQVKNAPYMRELLKLLPPLPKREDALKNGRDTDQFLEELERVPVLDLLAAQEHRRWCNFHYASGYAGYDPDRSRKGKISKVEENGEEYYGKVHYCLIDDWTAMKEDQEARKTIIYDVCSIYGYTMCHEEENVL